MPTADQLIDLIRPDFDALNKLLISQLGSEIDLIEEVSQYLIQSGGKRVRPLVTLMAARALGTDNDHHIPLAASIACLHCVQSNLLSIRIPDVLRKSII